MYRAAISDREFKDGVAKLREEHIHPDDRDDSPLRFVDVRDAATGRVVVSKKLVFDGDVLGWDERRWKAWLDATILESVLPDWFCALVGYEPREVYAAVKRGGGGRLATSCVPLEIAEVADMPPHPTFTPTFMPDRDFGSYELWHTRDAMKALADLRDIEGRQAKRFDISVTSGADGASTVTLETSLSDDVVTAALGSHLRSSRPGMFVSSW